MAYVTVAARRTGPAKLRSGERVVPYAIAAYGAAAVVLLTVFQPTESRDAYATLLGPIAASTAFAALALAALRATGRPGRPWTSLAALAVLWDVQAWAGLQHTPLAVRLTALALPVLVPAVVFDAAVRWSNWPARSVRWIRTMLYCTGGLVVLAHVALYDPLEDISCRVWCVPADLPLAGHPTATHVAVVVDGAATASVGLVAASVLGIAAARAGARAWRTVGSVYAASAVAELTIAATASATWRTSPTQAGTWRALFACRASTALIVALAMIGSASLSRRVTRQVERLGEELGEPARVARSISRIVRDPGLQVDYWYPDGERWVDASGATIQRDPEVAAVNVTRDGVPVARIVGSSARHHVDLGGTVGAAALLAVDNSRLAAVARARLDDLRASRKRLVRTGDAERQQLERDLHDGAQQQLVSVAMYLAIARSEANGPSMALALEAAEQRARAISADLRDIAHGIFPPALTNRGVAAAVVDLAETTRVRIDLAPLEILRYPADVEMAAYAFVQDALSRAEAAGAERVRIAVIEHDGSLRIDLALAGQGMGEAEALLSAEGHVADRLAAVDGVLAVTQTDFGLSVSASIPIPSGDTTPGGSP